MDKVKRIINGAEYVGTLHPNGGGFVKDGVTVPCHIYIGESASVLGGTIEGGTIEGGTIRGGTIWGGTIRGGTIWGGTIRGGTIWGGTIEGGTIRGGTIWGGTIRGGTIWGGTIRGGTIEGGTIEKDVTFLTGCFPFPVTITDTHCAVGCKWFKHKTWLEQGVTIMDEEKEGYGKTYMPLLAKVIKMHQEYCKDS